MDPEFTQLDHADRLDARLAWEAVRFKRMVAEINTLWRTNVIWEVDLEQQRKQFQGMNSGDAAQRLQGLLEWGNQRGYRMEQTFNPAGGGEPHWRWYDGRRLVAEAMQTLGVRGPGAKPSSVVFYLSDGLTVRDDRYEPYTSMIRWSRPDTTLVRGEHGEWEKEGWRPTSWAWNDKNNKPLRYETDTNGDGLPDRFTDPTRPADSSAPLRVEQSWAVHPELIAEESRIPDQESRSVPIRRIPETP